MKTYTVEEFYGLEGNDLGAIKTMGITQVIVNDDDTISIPLKTNRSHMNTHGTIQGGMQYLICDTAIGAYVHYNKRPAVGMDGTIHYYRPAKEGETLTATVYPRKLGKKTSNFSVELIREDGKMVAEAYYSCMYL